MGFDSVACSGTVVLVGVGSQRFAWWQYFLMGIQVVVFSKATI